QTLTAVSNAAGNIFNNQFQPDAHDIGVAFYVTATGSASQAQTAFRDAGTECTNDSDPACDDHNPCTADTCNNGTYHHNNKTNGTSCSDGNVCNGAEVCQAGSCQPGTALNCGDGNACTTDT